jgi:hypothetical protein
MLDFEILEFRDWEIEISKFPNSKISKWPLTNVFAPASLPRFHLILRKTFSGFHFFDIR